MAGATLPMLQTTRLSARIQAFGYPLSTGKGVVAAPPSSPSGTSAMDLSLTREMANSRGAYACLA